MRKRFLILLALGLLLLMVAAPAYASALTAPWDGNPISQLLMPTSYGFDWPGGGYPDYNGEAVASRQTAPLALIPYMSIADTLSAIQDQAASAGVAPRMTWEIIGQSAAGRDMYGVVINALDTQDQRHDFQRYTRIREIELTDPARAQALLATADYANNIKIPIYVEANINGSEFEGTDAVMQAIRDLTVTPYGVNATVDKFLDHAILILNPCQNPDGRVLGIRGNSAVADTNRDFLVQSQPEERNAIKLEQEWLATAGLEMHGYVTPTLIDGLTMPHNPGLEWDLFGHWNQLRTAQNVADFNAMGYQAQVPVNDWDAAGNTSSQYTIAASPTGATEVGNTVTITTTGNASQIVVGARVTVLGVAEPRYTGTFTVVSKPTTTSFTYTNPTAGLASSGGGTVAIAAGSPNRGPAFAQGWDDWGPFYGQTYQAFLGVDSSTIEMPSTNRLVSKTAQYMAFYSSVNFWIDNRQAMINAQLQIFRRGVEAAPYNPNLIQSDPVLAALGFTDLLHNWTVQYPQACVIPVGVGQRSDAEANRLVEWLFENGILVRRATSDFTWNATSYQAGSYIVYMNQALRGLAWNALTWGTDIESRITQLYASPAAWSHGIVWGADTALVPYGDATFVPTTEAITTVNTLVGGVRGGVGAPSDWYAVTLKGVHEDQALLGLLGSGVFGELAEAPFTSTTGGLMPAGSLIFPADPTTAAALDAAGQAAGMWFERNVGVAKPPVTKVRESPMIAILATSVPTSGADTDGVLHILFGADAQYVATTAASGSLETAASDPLADYDVIYNAGAPWPTSSASIATTSTPGATQSGTTVTITMSSAPAGNLAVGSSVTINGVVVAGYNGAFTVTSIVSPTKFTYTCVVTGLANSGGGTVTSPDINGIARARLNAFFARGGGYIAQNSSTNNFSFLTGAAPALVTGGLTQGSQSAYGGIAVWANAGGVNSPLTGGYPAKDYLFLPSNTTYFTAWPTGSVVDGQYLPTMATMGPANGYVAGMWLNRNVAANNAPVLVRGSTAVGSRYMAYSTNPTSRYDAERSWPLIVQAALWSNLTDEAYTITSSAGPNGSIAPLGEVEVASGGSQTFTITPAAGCGVADVLVDGVSVGKVTSYAFTNVTKNHTIAATFVAVAPPVVSDDAPVGWQNHAVTVTITATDPDSGVASVEYRLDAGSWTLGTSVLVAAPRNGSNDGVHTIEYRATNNAGVVSDVQSCTVSIDTQGPVVTASAVGLVRRGATVNLRYKVTDTYSPTATVTITVRDLRGRTVATWLAGSVATGVTQTYQTTIALARGMYSLKYEAVDEAGNTQKKAGSATMIVF